MLITLALWMAMLVSRSAQTEKTWHNSTTIGWITMKLRTDIHVVEKLNPYDFGDVLTFSVAPQTQFSFVQWNISTSAWWIGKKNFIQTHMAPRQCILMTWLIPFSTKDCGFRHIHVPLEMICSNFGDSFIYLATSSGQESVRLILCFVTIYLQKHWYFYQSQLYFV